MDIKIKPNPGLNSIPEIKENASSTVENAGATDVVAESSADPVTQVALDLAAGRIDTAQAVNALISQTMSTEMVARAPAALRQEVEAVLRDAIENDPYLAGLVHQMD